MGADQLSQWQFVGKDLHVLAPPFNVGARFRARWKGTAHWPVHMMQIPPH